MGKLRDRQVYSNQLSIIQCQSTQRPKHDQYEIHKGSYFVVSVSIYQQPNFHKTNMD